MSSVFRWLEANESFREKYARARSLQADAIADQVLVLSDRCREGQKTEVRTENGKEVRKVQTGDMVERTRLQIDARKWYAGKVAPLKYGERTAHQLLDEHGQPAKAGIMVIVDGAPGAPKE